MFIKMEEPGRGRGLGACPSPEGYTDSDKGHRMIFHSEDFETVRKGSVRNALASQILRSDGHDEEGRQKNKRATEMHRGRAGMPHLESYHVRSPYGLGSAQRYGFR